MKKIILSFLFIFISINIFALSGNDIKNFNEAVQKANIAPLDFCLEPSHDRNGGTGAFSQFYTLWDNWQRIPDYGNFLAENSFSNKLTKIIELYTGNSDCELSDDIKDNIKTINSQINDKNSFENALKEIHGEYVTGNSNMIPKDIKKAVATIIYASVIGNKYRESAFSDSFIYENLFTCLQTCGNNIDRSKLISGAYILSHYIDTLSINKSKNIFYVSIKTDLGLIELSNGENNNYNNTNSFLVIDTSGNDTYTEGYAGTDKIKHISIVIDTEGDDIYDTSENSSFGAGIMGYGILIDKKGNDKYHTGSFSLGAGYGGFGAIMDFEGDDTYKGISCCEGSASNGLGVIKDFSGKDYYYAYDFSQGYGGPGGVGIIAENKGNDTYIADDKNIINPSPQTELHNTSMSQGAGFGLRNSQIAGGIGLLADKEGDDYYTCGVFGQGISYWYSFGALVDYKGNDTHKAIWYCYGAAAHYSIGCFIEKEGNDTYETENAFGLGHDYSIGYFEDKKGNDKYTSINTPIGWTNANGLTLFFDCGGNDDYSKTTISGATNSRSTNRSYGIFIDKGGKNILSPQETEAGKLKDKYWITKEISDNPNALAIGMLK